jgi:hypothetical protein
MTVQVAPTDAPSIPNGAGVPVPNCDRAGDIQQVDVTGTYQE